MGLGDVVSQKVQNQLFHENLGGEGGAEAPRVLFFRR
jgi:hypothetical protein